MISYKEWKTLNESLGLVSLGLSQKQSLGITGSRNPAPAEGELEEGMGMGPGMGGPAIGKPSKKFGKPGFGGDDMGDMDDMGDEDMDMDGEDMDGEEGDEDELEDGDEMPIDPDAEFEDDDMDGMDGEEEEDMDMDGEGDEEIVKKKKFPMGQPHMGGPFMNFSRRMKEACGGEDMDKEGGDEEGGDLKFMQKKQKKQKFLKKMSAGDTAAKEGKVGKPSANGKAAPKGKGGVSKGTPQNQKYVDGKTTSADGFKKDTFEKNCSDGKMCAKCSDKMKGKKEMKESGYGRPKDYDPSEKAFVDSLVKMYGNPGERFSDGMRDFSEDMLLPTPEPMPGEVGYAPQTRVGTDVNSMAESMEHLIKKIAQLEDQLKDTK
jgi:hypothetical protein